MPSWVKLFLKTAIYTFPTIGFFMNRCNMGTFNITLLKDYYKKNIYYHAVNIDFH